MKFIQSDEDCCLDFNSYCKSMTQEIIDGYIGKYDNF